MQVRLGDNTADFSMFWKAICVSHEVGLEQM